MTAGASERGGGQELGGERRRVPGVEIFFQHGELGHLTLEELTGLEMEEAFLLWGDLAGQHAGAQEDEVGVQRIAEAVVVDVLEPSLGVELVNLVAGDVHFAGQAEEAGEQVQSAGEGISAAVGKPVEQVEDGGAVAVAVEQVLLQGEAEAEGGQLQKRNVKSQTVEGDQAGHLIGRQAASRVAQALVAAPELAGDLAGAEERGVQLRQRLQGEVLRDAGDAHRHRQMERHGEKIGLALLAGFLLRPENGRVRVQVFTRITDLGQKLAIGNALGIEHEVSRPAAALVAARGVRRFR